MWFATQTVEQSSRGETSRARPMTPTTISLNRRGSGDGTRSARAPIVRQVTSTRTPFLFSGMKRAGLPISVSGACTCGKLYLYRTEKGRSICRVGPRMWLWECGLSCCRRVFAAGLVVRWRWSRGRAGGTPALPAWSWRGDHGRPCHTPMQGRRKIGARPKATATPKVVPDAYAGGAEKERGGSRG